MQMTMSKRRFVLILILTAVLSMVVLGVFLYYGSAYQKARQGLKSYDALIAFQNGTLKLEDTVEDVQVYGGSGYWVYVQGDYVIQATDEHTGCTQLFQNGILQAVTTAPPMREAVRLCTPFDPPFSFTLRVRSQEETDKISAAIQEQGSAYLRENDFDYILIDNRNPVIL